MRPSILTAYRKDSMEIVHGPDYRIGVGQINPTSLDSDSDLKTQIDELKAHSKVTYAVKNLETYRKKLPEGFEIPDHFLYVLSLGAKWTIDGRPFIDLREVWEHTTGEKKWRTLGLELASAFEDDWDKEDYESWKAFVLDLGNCMLINSSDYTATYVNVNPKHDEFGNFYDISGMNDDLYWEVMKAKDFLSVDNH